MPNYGFKCPKCETEKEEYLQIKDRNITQACPKCETIMDRLVGAGGGFNLKGEGFYKQGWNS